ncbi:8-oxoguanine DNA glycosylase OGG fold protein [Micromonospora sp. CPCC 205558]|uniref:8-oxoguanine DNA glycosylase OGG fold protein n=1 Tax=Micromonospora sp. CPCC 205558 TaxID=3122403 RepID=UPI002FEF6934
MSAGPNGPAAPPCDYRTLLPDDASTYDKGVVEGGLTAEEQGWLRQQRRDWQLKFDGARSSPEELVSGHSVDVVPERWAKFDQWLALDSGASSSLSLSRGAVTDVARQCRERELWLPLLVTSFAWGWGNSGFGPARLSWVLNGKAGLPGSSTTEIQKRLAAAVDVLDQRGAGAAYQLLLDVGRISEYGPAFFTKFLYFASRAVSGQYPALILDARLARQMQVFWQRRANEPYAVNGRSARWLWEGPRWSTRRYQIYRAFICRSVAQLSEPGERWTPELAELLLFRATRVT